MMQTVLQYNEDELLKLINMKIVVVVGVVAAAEAVVVVVVIIRGLRPFDLTATLCSLSLFFTYVEKELCTEKCEHRYEHNKLKGLQQKQCTGYLKNNNNNEHISRAPFHVKHAQLR